MSLNICFVFGYPYFMW